MRSVRKIKITVKVGHEQAQSCVRENRQPGESMRAANGRLILWLLLLLANLASAQCSDIASTCAAGVPHLIRFRGVLKNSVGQPGKVGITFAIYSDSIGGAALWQESQNVRIDEQGRYAVLLGVTTQEGVPPELFSSGQPRWLGVQSQAAGRIRTAQDTLGKRAVCVRSRRRPNLRRFAPVGFFEGGPRQFRPVV